jgi:hypothetical protein
MPQFLNASFKAVIDESPSLSKPKFIVSGDVSVPSSGWKATLARKEPQGFDPLILLLDLRTEQPYGSVDQVAEKIHVRYEESPPKNHYTQATIFEGKDSVTIDVASVG